MGGTNILEPLSWILRQPVFSGHPRLLFLLTDGAVSNTGKVIELVRSHARYTRQESHCKRVTPSHSSRVGDWRKKEINQLSSCTFCS